MSGVYCGMIQSESKSRFLCDKQRHLICEPYSIAALHRMAEALQIKRCWFHGDHYDIPKRRISEIRAKCEQVRPREILRIIREGGVSE